MGCVVSPTHPDKLIDEPLLDFDELGADTYTDASLAAMTRWESAP